MSNYQSTHSMETASRVLHVDNVLLMEVKDSQEVWKPAE